jgi:hypothetical protein
LTVAFIRNRLRKFRIETGNRHLAGEHNPDLPTNSR